MKCNNCLGKSLFLLVKPIKDCFAKCFNLLNCCKCQCCCHYNKETFESEEIDFCLCYQKKGILKWIFDSIDNEDQKLIIVFAFLNFYCQFFTLGYEAEFEEKNKDKNIEQFNIFIPLILVCSFFVFNSFIISSCTFKPWSSHFLPKFNAKELSFLFFMGAFVIDFIISICSLITSINYLNVSINSLKKWYKYFLYCLIITNKFLIFTLSYICTKLDNENELVSNTSFTSIYLYLFDLILYGIKKISSLKALKILQIISSVLFIILLNIALKNIE